MKRRIIAALMCLCMLVGLLPMSAFAADPGTVTAKKELVSQTPDENGNYTIKLTVQGEPVEIPSESAADVVLVVDNSGSMASSVGEPCLTPKSEFKSKLTFLWYRYTCPNCGARYSSSLAGLLWDTRPPKCTGQKGAEPRINTAKKVGKTFAQTILKDGNANQLAVIGFAHNSENGGPNDANALFVTQPLTNDLTQINNKIDKMDADGGTNYSAALQQAYKWLNNRADKTRPAYVIFISDGAPGLSGESIDDSQWNGSKQAADLKRDGVTLYTIGIALTDDESNYLESLATDSNHYINVTGTNYADKLKKVLLEWASHINSVPAGKNAVMTDVVNTEYFDVVTPLPAGVTLGSDGKTLVWNIGAIPKDETSIEITIKPKADVLNTITGTKTVNTNTNVSLAYVDYNGADQTIPKEQIGDPTVNLIGTKPAEYTLTYDGNAQGGTVSNVPTDSHSYLVNADVTLITNPDPKPTHTDVNDTTVLFIGWTETQTTQIFKKGDTAPTTVASVTMIKGGKTVYAAWGYDANGNGTPDYKEETEDAYFYVLKPSVTDATGTDPQNFFYVGQGSIFKNTQDVTKFTDDGVKENISKLPDATRLGQIGAGDIAGKVGENFSNVLWYRIKTANGANSNNSGSPIVGPGTGTRHVDGLLKPENGKYGMIFMYDGGAVYYVTIDVNSKISADAMAAANNAALTAADKTADQWNVVWKNADGSVADVANATGEAGQLLFFYADFAEKTATYTLSYDANAQQGGTVDNMPSNPTTRYSSGHVETLDSRVPSHSDVNGQKVVFIGWSKTKSNKIYSASEGYGDIVSKVTFANANITVYAVWGYDSNDDDGHHSSYTLYYHSNFGEDVTFYQSSSTRSVTVKEYENVGRLPERDGYVFVSWNTEPDGSGERYMPGDPFHIKGSSDHLYAQWQKDKTGPDDSGVSNWLETDEHRAYLTGYPDSTFRADRNMTRAEVAQMFYALLLDKNVTITKSFSDVPDDAWYATAVKTLASLGMMDGYPDGTFRPDEPITRAEFATVGLAFAYDPLDASCSYYDVGANAWYYTYVAQATTYGWIGGYPDNTFRPGNNITRVEVCVIVNNMLGRDADERYIDRHEDELVHFVDLSDSYWGYYTIMESTNTHEYTGSFTNEKWTDVK